MAKSIDLARFQPRYIRGTVSEWHLGNIFGGVEPYAAKGESEKKELFWEEVVAPAPFFSRKKFLLKFLTLRMGAMATMDQARCVPEELLRLI